MPGADYNQIQYFISESPWGAKELMDGIAREAGLLFAQQANVYLYFDGSAHTQKGNKSIGVGRQYTGQLDKVHNCQVAVYAALSAVAHYILIDTRLFCPKTGLPTKAGIPRDRLSPKTKLGLALDRLKHHQTTGVRFNWVGGDGFYGHDIIFRKSIAAMTLTYMLDIHKKDGV